jgi:tetratricopeptide (TPR) repeat protein
MLITSIIMVWIYHRKSISVNKIALKTGALIITALIVYILIPVKSNPERPDIIKTAESIFDRNYYSNQSRIDFWGASLKMFTNNPIFGIGAGKWAGNYPPYSGGLYTDENVDMNFAINPHNDYLEILVEYGLSGFILFSLFIFAGLYSLFKKSKSDINYLPYFISALGICILMFFSFTKDNFWVMMIFAVCMGAGYSSIYELGIRNYEFLNKYKNHLKKAIVLIGILMMSIGIYFKVMNYLSEREYIEAMKFKAQGKYSEMLEKLDGVSSLYYPVDMNKMPVDYYRGVGYFELKQYDKALEKFRNAREYMKYYPTIMNNEASALYMTGKNNEAEQIYIEIKGMFPNYIEPQINLLSFYTNQKRIPEAKGILAELEKKTINTKYVKNYSVYLQIKDYFKETIQ